MFTSLFGSLDPQNWRHFGDPGTLRKAGSNPSIGGSKVLRGACIFEPKCTCLNPKRAPSKGRAQKNKH